MGTSECGQGRGVVDLVAEESDAVLGEEGVVGEAVFNPQAAHEGKVKGVFED